MPTTIMSPVTSDVQKSAARRLLRRLRWRWKSAVGRTNKPAAVSVRLPMMLSSASFTPSV